MMETYLLCKEERQLPLLREISPGVTHRHTKFVIGTPEPVYNDGSSSASAEANCRLITEALREFSQESDSQNDRSICAHYKTASNNDRQIQAQLHGQFLDTLYYLFNGDVQIRLFGVYQGGKHLDTGYMPVKKKPSSSSSSLVSECGGGGKMEMEVVGETWCENGATMISPLLYTWLPNTNHEGILFFTMSLRVSSVISPTDDEIGDKMGCCRRILGDEDSADVVIVPKNGSEVKCHGMFLIAHSEVLARMLRKRLFEEGRRKRIIMDDMSESGVRALLSYLYTWDVRGPLKSFEMALELLEASHKYAIPPLESKMRRLLGGRPAHWFSVEQAFQLFHSGRLVEGWEDLRAKAVTVMKSKSKDVQASDEFKTLMGDKSEGRKADLVADLISALLAA